MRRADAFASMLARAFWNFASAKRRKMSPRTGVPYSDAFRPELARSSSAASQSRSSSLAEVSLQGDAPGVQIQIVRASPQSLSWAAAGPGGGRFEVWPRLPANPARGAPHGRSLQPPCPGDVLVEHAASGHRGRRLDRLVRIGAPPCFELAPTRRGQTVSSRYPDIAPTPRNPQCWYGFPEVPPTGFETTAGPRIEHTSSVYGALSSLRSSQIRSRWCHERCHGICREPRASARTRRS